MYYFEILVSQNLNQTFTYKYHSELSIGQIVKIDFADRIINGLIIKKQTIQPQGKNYIIKDITHPYKEVIFTSEIIKFIKFVAQYNLISLGNILQSFLIKDIIDIGIISCDSTLKHKIKKTIEKNSQTTTRDAIKEMRISSIHKMIKKGDLIISPINHSNHTIELAYILEPKQEEIKNSIIKYQDNFKVSLIDGVTGSGKTAIYISIISELLNSHIPKQALILIPEIALTVHLIQNIRKYITPKSIIQEWHSGISEHQKSILWDKIIIGEKMIIIGTRSALFLPYKNISVIVVDEEHDTSLKDTNSSINTRDMAIMLSKIKKIPVILSSATPSLESIYQAEQKKYDYYQIKSRFQDIQMPSFHAVDMRKTKMKTKNISEPLYEAIKNTLNRNNQVLLFINKRGFAPIILCNKCGTKVKCRFCSSFLNYHKKEQKLICHLCGYNEIFTSDCKKCNTVDSIIDHGPGIEKIAQEINILFPQAQYSILSSDTIYNKKLKAKALEGIENQQVDIIIGTQLISKGYHFSKIELIGVIDGDNNVSSIDLRNTEKTFQLLTQVIGRAGREKMLSASAIIQTFQPENKVIQAILNLNRDILYKQELSERKKYGMPPYTRATAIIFSGKNEEKTLQFASIIKKIIEKEQIMTLGPSIAPIRKMRCRYRVRILLIYPRDFNIHKNLNTISEKAKALNKDIKTRIDINPLEFS
ncbi:primosomal protein N' [Anaplasmataceae bacterium AB001_6]|nr:primosomal protein N' [Anaplasmataceae bacterium AB001_6]